MPIYEYRRPDGTTFEVMQSISDEAFTTDPETGVAVERVLHAPAVHFKGKGFYNTDYGTRKRQRESQSDTGGGTGSSEKTAAQAKGDADAAAPAKEKAEKPKKAEAVSSGK